MEPKMARAWLNDATVEALARRLAENPRGCLLWRDELSGWAQSMNSYKGGKGSDRQFFLSLWSSMATAVDRVSEVNPLILDQPFLAITGMIQPDTVEALLHE